MLTTGKHTSMQWIRFTIFVMGLAIIQTGLLDIIAIGAENKIKPDLLLIAMIFFAIYYKNKEVIISSFAIGFVADVSAGTFIGSQTLAFGLLGSLIGFLNKALSIKKMGYQAAAILIISLTVKIITAILTKIRGQHFDENIYSIILFVSIYSAVVGPFLFLPYRWLMGQNIRRHNHN